MRKINATAALVFSARLFAVQVPAGTELSIRLTSKISSEFPATKQPIEALLIAPVIVNGKTAVQPGARLTGTIRLSKAAREKEPAQLQLVFTELSEGEAHATLSAVVSSLDNARETLDDKGVIVGIAPGETFSARIDQGISRLENNKLAGLAVLIQGTKGILNIQEANPNIEYDPGAELSVRLVQPLEWRSTDAGPAVRLEPFPDEAVLIDLVQKQPFRTMTQSSARPSDLTNLMFLATEDELRAAFEKAGWFPATRLDALSKLETARALIEARGYKEGPMSTLLLDGHPPELSYQKGNNTFAQRHHLRIFRRPGTFQGKPIWVCSATHDTGIDFSDRDRTFIHRIDPQIDKERTKVINDILFNGVVRSLTLVQRPGIPRDATNATGDPLQTDASMAVLLFK